jgi:quercetin dioxygenase-like cupin family protein
MPDAALKKFESPDETMALDHARIDVVNVGGGTAKLFTFEPGWNWAEHATPVMGTDVCQNPHFVYQVSGRLGVRMEDGREMEFVPGSVGYIPPGHDAWVAGDEPAVLVDWADAPAPVRE